MGFLRRRRIRQPVQGWAEVVEAWPRPVDMTEGNCRMKLRLDDVPGVEPQVVDHHELVVRLNRWPEVGMRVAVTVDASHPDRVDVDWDSVFGEVLGGKLGVAAEYLATAASIDLDLSKGRSDVPQGKPAPDHQEQIAALNARYAAGEITYEEMTDGVRRALGAL